MVKPNLDRQQAIQYHLGPGLQELFLSDHVAISDVGLALDDQVCYIGGQPGTAVAYSLKLQP